MKFNINDKYTEPLIQQDNENHKNIRNNKSEKASLNHASNIILS